MTVELVPRVASPRLQVRHVRFVADRRALRRTGAGLVLLTGYPGAVLTPLGKLVRVDPRTVWKHEAHDFTPWLAANIEVLGAAIGMDLEVVE